MRPAIEDCLRQLVVIVKSHASKPVQPDIAESVETIQHIANRVTPPPEQLVTVVDQLIVASEACKADEPKRALLLGPMSALIKCLGPRLLSRAQHVTRIGRALCGLTNSRKFLLSPDFDCAEYSNTATLQARGLDILHGILNHLGSFVASFAVDFVNVCMREDVVMKDQMASLRNTMARQIPLKTIVPAYNKAWQQATKKPSVSVICLHNMYGADSLPLQSALILLRLIRSSIDATESKLVLPEHKTVFQLLQQAWEYSGIREDEIHSATTSGFLALVMKLNESAFKPLLLRTVDWAFVDAETTCEYRILQRVVKS